MRTLPAGAGSGHKFDRKNNEDHKNHMRTMDKHIKVHNQDWQDVVVCNMHPFPVQQHFGDAGLVFIEGCKEGEPYNAHVIDMYRITKADKGNGEYEPIEILPVEQAIEIEKKYQTMGGVFWHFTSESVPTDKLKAAGARQMAYYRALVRKARDEWARYHNMARISDAMRGAARYLAKLGEVNIREFDWVEKMKQPICPQCGEEHPDRANVCKHCEFPLNVEWVRRFRKDLVAKYGLGDGPQAGDAPAGTAPTTITEFLDEEMSADDQKLFGGN